MKKLKKCLQKLPQSPKLLSEHVYLSLPHYLAAACTFTTYRRHIYIQAYIQAEKELDRRVCIEAPVEMGFGSDHVHACVKPLYGISESGLSFFF